MRIIFVRHGETEINAAGLTHKTGSNIGLSQIGKGQIKKLIPILQSNKVEKLFYSSEKRTKETAGVILEDLKIPAKKIPDLTERNWGEWEGKSWEEIKAVLDPMSLEERYAFIPPGGESWKQAEKRLKDTLEKIIKSREKSICIITHAGSIRILMPVLKNEPRETSFKYDFHNASFTIFDFENGRFKLVTENNIEHLMD